MKVPHLAFSIFLGTTALVAQPPARVEFEVASIKPVDSAMENVPVNVGVRIDGAQVHISSLPLRDLVAIAYRLKNYQVSAPDWMGTARFQVTATLPAGSEISQMTDMMKSLLADRFHLKVHNEKKDFQVYALETEKGGLKIQPKPQDTTDVKPGVNIEGSGGRQGVAVNLGNGSSFALVPNHFDGTKLSMQVLAANMERFLDRPVVDMTGSTGVYDFTLDLTEDDYRAMLIHAGVNSGVVLPPQALQAMERASLGSLYSGLQKIGLKLEPKKAPLDYLVVDSSLKSPTEN